MPSRHPRPVRRAARWSAPWGAVLLLSLAAAPELAAQGPAPRTPQRPAAQPGGPVTRIVAVVNGDVITSGDIDSRRRLLALSAGIDVAAGSSADQQILRLLIDERLRMQEVARRRIPVTDEDIAASIQEIESRNNMPSGTLRTDLRRAGIEARTLYDQIRAQIGWGRLLRSLLGSQAEASEADVRDFIANAQARTGQPEYLVAEIFIPIENPGQEREVQRFAGDVIQRLRGGLPFAVAATQFSQAQTALQGGDLGWVRPEQMDPEVARIVSQMPEGAVSNPIKVAGGYQIVTLRQKRLSGRDMATILTIRQAFFAFPGTLDPQNPTAQQVQLVERAQQLAQAARGCDAVEAANRGGPRPADPGQVRLETVQPEPLKQLLAGLQVGRASQPIISSDGVSVIAVCARETRNLAEVTPEQARAILVRDRVELLSRQLQRNLRRRAQIEIRGERREQPAQPAPQQRAG